VFDRFRNQLATPDAVDLHGRGLLVRRQDQGVFWYRPQAKLLAELRRRFLPGGCEAMNERFDAIFSR
jgi:hypothetical protein